MAAPRGNRNAAKAKVWTAAIERALDRKKPADERIKAIDELADKFLDVCMAGDLQALKELGDRLEGKAAQAVTVDVNPIDTLDESEQRALLAALTALSTDESDADSATATIN